MKGGINKNKWIHLRLSEAEHRAIRIKVKKTTSRNVSQYLRDVIFDRPIVATYRNISQDDMTQQIAILNNELNAMGNNLNQITKRLHTLRIGEQQVWGLHFTAQAGMILSKLNEIKEITQAIAERWLR